MAGQWKIELVPDEEGAGGSGTAYWWEESTTVGTQEHDFTYSCSGLNRETADRNAFLSDAIVARDKWQLLQEKKVTALALGVTWAGILNGNDPKAVT